MSRETATGGASDPAGRAWGSFAAGALYLNIADQSQTGALDQARSEAVILASSISKLYRVYAKPVDRLKQSVLGRFKRLLGSSHHTFYNEFWALRDVSFEVSRGSTVGIIGRNGSGKSTLLQILCGTLAPSTGQALTKGRVAAMLELGSGFNPEFTGRENVVMNGMVLGLTQDEVLQRFESIAAFADIGEFIDQPVKTYSSGMLVRLAFAVIVHVDADILVIDEALAVGDAVFGQKCMRFLRRFKEHGTILFVSHDISSVMNLCSEAIWLDRGAVRMYGAAKTVADAYAQFCATEASNDNFEIKTLGGAGGDALRHEVAATEEDGRIHFFDNIADSEGWTTGLAQITDVRFGARLDPARTVFAGGERVELVVRATRTRDVARPIIGFLFRDRLGQALFGQNTCDERQELADDFCDTLTARFAFVMPLLPDGTYTITVAIADGDLLDHVQHHWVHDAVIVKVSSSRKRYGLVGIPFESVVLSSGGHDA